MVGPSQGSLPIQDMTNAIYMHRAGFEPVNPMFEPSKTVRALYYAAIVTGQQLYLVMSLRFGDLYLMCNLEVVN
jgi:hypothetical protein